MIVIMTQVRSPNENQGSLNNFINHIQNMYMNIYILTMIMSQRANIIHCFQNGKSKKLDWNRQISFLLQAEDGK